MILMKETMRGLTEKEVEHIAWLAKVELSEEEKIHFTRQFNSIIKYFHVLDEAVTEGVKPMLHVVDLINVYREDVTEDPLPHDTALANASRKEKGYFKAPKII